MNFEAFKTSIKTADKATLDKWFDEISTKLARARTPSRRLGYALALDELVIEAGNRTQGPIDCNMTIEEILAELGV